MTLQLIFPYDRTADRALDAVAGTDMRADLPRIHTARDYQVSVILPMYNVRAYVLRCLTSVLHQTDIRLQVIVVNDGSTDDSLNTVLQHLDRHPAENIIVVQQPNRGLSAARNTGIAFALADHVAFLDTDDFVSLGAYATAHRFAVRHSLEMVIFRSLVFDSVTLELNEFYDDEIWNRILGPGIERITDCDETSELLMLEPNANTRLIRRDFFIEKDLFFPEGLVFEDYPIHVKAILNARKIGLLDPRLYHYRINRPGKITDAKSAKRFDAIEIVDQTLKIALRHSLTDRQGASILYALIRLAHWCGSETVLADRRRFFSELAQRFGSVPRRWEQAFKRDFSDYGKLTVLSALRRNDVDYLIKSSWGQRQIFKTPYILLRQQCYRALGMRFHEILKNRVPLAAAVFARLGGFDNAAP